MSGPWFPIIGSVVHASGSVVGIVEGSEGIALLLISSSPACIRQVRIKFSAKQSLRAQILLHGNVVDPQITLMADHGLEIVKGVSVADTG